MEEYKYSMIAYDHYPLFEAMQLVRFCYASLKQPLKALIGVIIRDGL